MSLKELKTVEQLKMFMEGTQSIAFAVPSSASETYLQIEQALLQFSYYRLVKREKGLVLRFLAKLSGYSRQQLTRLVKQYRATGNVRLRKRSPTSGFSKRYAESDIAVLARMDELHGAPSGPVLKKLCERAFLIYGDKKYSLLSGISVSHIYNLRRSSVYRRQCIRVHLTQRSKDLSIGIRKKPHPEGRAGFLRVDSVHQGDQDKRKGVYHVNAVDEVTQFEVVITVERISESHMLPALEQILEALPFTVLGFHSDNGSEYINRQVAQMLEKLRVELTKSRARRSNDNALVESKNGAVVRRIYGYAHIPRHFAELINRFNREHLVPYLNFHRPCFFPSVIVDKKGKEKKEYKYEHLMTPYEKLKSLPNAGQYLKGGIRFEMLDAQVAKMSDNEAARLMTQAKDTLFKEIFGQLGAQG